MKRANCLPNAMPSLLHPPRLTFGVGQNRLYAPYICARIYMHCIYAPYICARIYMHRIYASIYMHVYMCTYICARIYMHVYIYARIYMHVYIYAHIFDNTPAKSALEVNLTETLTPSHTAWSYRTNRFTEHPLHILCRKRARCLPYPVPSTTSTMLNNICPVPSIHTYIE